MSLSLKHRHSYFPVKYFLTSYRTLSDGNTGIRHLEEYLENSNFLLSDWKVIWIGTCALLRTSIDLFKVDAKSCINSDLREQIRLEWNAIKTNKECHPIFWEFLRKERDNILHEYQWTAYEAWMNQDGSTRTASITLLEMKPEDVNNILIMRSGTYKDRNSLDLLRESSNWVESRIRSAIRRAGYDPDEERNFANFQKKPLGLSDAASH